MTFRHAAHAKRTQFWALVLFVLSVLSSTISQGVHANQVANAPWSVVCTTVADSGAQGPHGAGADGAGLQHCALCLAHGQADALLDTQRQQAYAPAFAMPVPATRPGLSGARSLARHDAPPRAPPRHA